MKIDHPITKHSRQRVTITGGAGFIGSHLAEALLARGKQVTIIDNLSTGKFENIAHLVTHPDFNFCIDSVTNEIVLDRIVSESDVIFHLAAVVGVRQIVERPVHTIETNVLGTEAVLRAALRYRAKVMIASTSEVYGKGMTDSFSEEDDVVIGPTSRNRWAYAATKMVDEFLGLAYHNEYHLPVVGFRLFNTVGPRQTGEYGMVLPRLVGQALKHEKLTVHSDGLQSRCFLHVSDAVEALISLEACPAAIGQVTNIGSTEEITICDLARRVLKAVDGSPQLPPPDDARIDYIPYEQAYNKNFDDMRRRLPNISKIRALTGWQPKRNMDDILKDVIETMKKDLSV